MSGEGDGERKSDLLSPWRTLLRKLWPAAESSATTTIIKDQEEHHDCEDDPRGSNRKSQEEWEEAVSKLFGGLSSSLTTASCGITDIRHVQQFHNWDCGIACLQMVADWLLFSIAAPADNSNKADDPRLLRGRDWMLQQVGTESIWTVDLVYILQLLRWEQQQQKQTESSTTCFSYLFCSKTLSVNEDLSQFSYYKDAFAQDRIRVQMRFARVAELRLPTLQLSSSLRMDQVIDCIQKSRCVAIALVDNHFLVGQSRSGNADNKPYSGHYILLTGLSEDGDHIRQAAEKDPLTTASDNNDGVLRYCLVVRNPGSRETVSYFTTTHFERAWRAPGTDEDIIFVVQKACD